MKKMETRVTTQTIDETDLQILALLKENARISLKKNVIKIVRVGSNMIDIGV